MKKFKLTLTKRFISENTGKNVLPLKHERYLARVHTLVGSAMSFLIALGLFYIAGTLEGFFSFTDRTTIFIFSLITAITITVTIATYIYWKTIRIEAVEDMIDIYENKLSKKKPI